MTASSCLEPYTVTAITHKPALLHEQYLATVYTLTAPSRDRILASRDQYKQHCLNCFTCIDCSPSIVMTVP